jgi:ABC-2 type transport system ATP-binding protein
MARAERLLLEQPLVTRVAAQGLFLRVRLELPQGATPTLGWVDEVSARIIAVLVGAGLPVCSVKTHELDLEDAFMTVTQGAVQ